MYGDRIWSIRQFIGQYPGLTGWYAIPSDNVDVRLYRKRDRLRYFTASLLSQLTFGRYVADDCVGVIVAILRDNGVVVPRHITTPGKLYSWMETRYEFTTTENTTSD
ncbi:hypothetical protein LCGC14_1515010 [marine sediment metagenome]|uniref:Uncharacterized protein n=1 Tax=marine sediment metagenome TaxID=412755 RepID=A0A0F9J0I3_9ZZZZ